MRNNNNLIIISPSCNCPGKPITPNKYIFLSRSHVLAIRTEQESPILSIL